MILRDRVRLLLLWLSALGLAAAEPLRSAGASELTPGEVLERTFRNTYELDRRAALRLVTRNRHGEVLEHRAQLASKRIAGRVHTLAYFTHPDYVLGTRILTIENDARSYDSFVYLPSLAVVRRITSAQRSQSLLGTDLTYEEFERRRVADFALEEMREERLASERVYVVNARPRKPTSHARVEFFVASSDFALLESRYYKRDAQQPFRILRTPREAMRHLDGHVVPTRVVLRNVDAGTETEVRIDQLAINPELEDRLFTVKTLEYGPPIPGLD